MSRPPPPSTFPRFGALPTEIRLLIWAEALGEATQPSVWALEPAEEDGTLPALRYCGPSPHPVPYRAAWTNRESFGVLESLCGPPVVGAHGRRAFPHLASSVLYLADRAALHVLNAWDAAHAARLAHVAVPFDLWTYSLFVMVVTVLQSQCPGLQTFIAHDHAPRRRRREAGGGDGGSGGGGPPEPSAKTVTYFTALIRSNLGGAEFSLGEHGVAYMKRDVHKAFPTAPPKCHFFFSSFSRADFPCWRHDPRGVQIKGNLTVENGRIVFLRPSQGRADEGGTFDVLG